MARDERPALVLRLWDRARGLLRASARVADPTRDPTRVRWRLTGGLSSGSWEVGTTEDYPAANILLSGPLVRAHTPTVPLSCVCVSARACEIV